MTTRLVGGSPARVQQLTATLAGPVAPGSGPEIGDTLIIWLDPIARTIPFPTGICCVVDLVALRPATVGVARRSAWRRAVAALCVGADLVLIGSETEAGLWTAPLEEAGVDAPLFILAPPACPVIAGPAAALSTTLDDPAGLPIVMAAAAWAATAGAAAAGAAGQGLPMVVGIPAVSGAPGLLTMRGLRALPNVIVLPHVAAPAGLILDARPDTAEARITTPPDLLAALGAGCPIVTTVAGILGQSLMEAGAGLVALPAGLAQALDAVHAARDTMGAAAQALAIRLHRPETGLPRAIEQVQSRRADIETPWHSGQGAPLLTTANGPGHVLVLSNDHDILLDVRVHVPLAALHRTGAIGGYTILHRGKIAFSTRPLAPGHDAPFAALWVHRSADSVLLTVLRALGVPYAYDLDDNLLASPQYRDRFEKPGQALVRTLLQQAAVLSCSTRRLASLLQDRAGALLAGRVVITPNLAPAAALPRAAGVPRAVIWASSDTPALIQSRPAIERAVRDFCLAHRIKLVCMGAPPGSGLAGPETEHVALLPRAAYLDYVRALSPALLICPLETGADPDTQDFVDGKSDVKMLDAAMAGLVGVYSAAAPYLDTDIPGAILCPNTYEGWLDGMEQGYRACIAGNPAPALPHCRTTAGGLLPWAQALTRARLAEPLSLRTVLNAYTIVADRRRRLLEPQVFDTLFYLAQHPDVAAAAAKGIVPSAYDHYLSSGFREGREARALFGADPAGEVWWDEIEPVITRLRQDTEQRQVEIDALQATHAARQALQQ